MLFHGLSKLHLILIGFGSYERPCIASCSVTSLSEINIILILMNVASLLSLRCF